MSFDNAYESIVEEHGDDSRWAYGTGFTDPLAGVDTTVPSTVDAAELARYCLMLGDDALVMSHRLQEWTNRLPELEDEVAVANIALDLLGQARFLLARAAGLPGLEDFADEDALAFLRTEPQFRCVRLVEVVNGDFAHLAARLLVFSTWRLALLARLVDSVDPVLAAVAAKGVKEVTYHRDYAARWVVRLGDGTPVSRSRIEAALAAVWPYVDELFHPTPVETRDFAVDPSGLRAEFDAVLDEVLAAATLERPAVAPMAAVAGKYGRDGVHTEALGYLLAEMQSIARSTPGATW